MCGVPRAFVQRATRGSRSPGKVITYEYQRPLEAPISRGRRRNRGDREADLYQLDHDERAMTAASKLAPFRTAMRTWLDRCRPLSRSDSREPDERCFGFSLESIQREIRDVISLHGTSFRGTPAQIVVGTMLISAITRGVCVFSEALPDFEIARGASTRESGDVFRNRIVFRVLETANRRFIENRGPLASGDGAGIIRDGGLFVPLALGEAMQRCTHRTMIVSVRVSGYNEKTPSRTWAHACMLVLDFDSHIAHLFDPNGFGSVRARREQHLLADAIERFFMLPPERVWNKEDDDDNEPDTWTESPEDDDANPRSYRTGPKAPRASLGGGGSDARRFQRARPGSMPLGADGLYRGRKHAGARAWLLQRSPRGALVGWAFGGAAEQCGTEGPQALQAREGIALAEQPGGFCAAWSLYQVHVALLYPESTSEEVMQMTTQFLSAAKTSDQIPSLTHFIAAYAQMIQDGCYRLITLLDPSLPTLTRGRAEHEHSLAPIPRTHDSVAIIPRQNAAAATMQVQLLALDRHRDRLSRLLPALLAYVRLAHL